MKRKFKIWTLRLTAMGLIVAGLLLIVILNPMLIYANKTVHGNYTIFHNTKLDPILINELDHATRFLRQSELYKSDLQLDFCLNDNSIYPRLIKALQGNAFAWGFYNKIVLNGSTNFSKKHVELNGYRWNLTQLLAHEMTHCLQFNNSGFWKSKPIADIPDWKWEGYAEYVSRQGYDQKEISKNITRHFAADKNKWEIIFADSTIAPREYYDYWILVQYCMDIKKMSYREILADTSGEQKIREEMRLWYSRKD
jgi:hypothetical protein